MSYQQIPLDKIHPSPFNPRMTFNVNGLAETMDLTIGVIEPITVRPMPGVEGEYEIVVGERRVRGARKAGHKTIPGVIKNLSDEDVMRMVEVENLQREDLSPAEEGKLFQMMQEKFGYSGATIGKMISKSPNYVTERLQLLDLPEEIITAVTITHGGVETEPTTMTFSKARALIPLEPEKQVVLAKKITEKGMTAEQVISTIKKADEVETIIARVRRPELRTRLESKYLHRVFEEDVKPKAIEIEIAMELGKPVGPSLDEQWRSITSQVWNLRRPYMQNSFVREWKSGDRRYIQSTIWMDFGVKVAKLVREDFPERRFATFEEADKYAKDHGGYCSGIVAMRGVRYWCIYVKA